MLIRKIRGDECRGRDSLEFTGEIKYTLKNDYMFKAVFQKNERIPKWIIASLLHISFYDIQSIHIENPVILGETVNNKDVTLDLHVILNNDMRMSIEMRALDLNPPMVLFWTQDDIQPVDPTDTNTAQAYPSCLLFSRAYCPGDMP